jgi:hypothetical protein
VPHSPVHIFSASLILGSLRCVGPILCLRALYTVRTLVNVEVSAGNINPLARIFGIARNWRVKFRGRIDAQFARNARAEKRKTVSMAPREFW